MIRSWRRLRLLLCVSGGTKILGVFVTVDVYTFAGPHHAFPVLRKVGDVDIAVLPTHEVDKILFAGVLDL